MEDKKDNNIVPHQQKEHKMKRKDYEGYTRVHYPRNPRKKRSSHPTRVNIMTRYSSYFYIYCYTCNNFGHRARDYKVISKRNINFVRKNDFPLVEMNIVCYKCKIFYHVSRDGRTLFIGPNMKYERKKIMPPKGVKENKFFEREEKEFERSLKGYGRRKSRILVLINLCFLKQHYMLRN